MDAFMERAFMERLKAAFEGITQALGGDPQDLKTTFGPVIDEIQYQKVWEHIDAGKKIAQTLTGGTKDNKGSQLIAPTIFVNPPDYAAVYEEVFGPVLCAKSFKTEEEALAMANNSQYGLAGTVFTKDLSRALHVSRKIQSGTFCINCALMVGPQAPMGGFKMSEIGRELGEDALRHYTEPMTIWIK